MAFQVVIIALSWDWWTIFGYALLWLTLFSVSKLNYELLSSLANHPDNNGLAIVFGYGLATPFTALITSLIFWGYFVVFPVDWILKSGGRDEGFILLWVCLATYVTSLTAVPIAYLVLSRRKARNIQS